MHARFASNWTDGYAQKIPRHLSPYAFPRIGGQPIAELEGLEVLDALRRVERQAGNRALTSRQHRSGDALPRRYSTS
ncbi:hypothetical protein [Pandoraea communis]|uniref:phage integrase central domain-containing protein n=1 Tax=Pandoraea TaxID=93217 RepID=UPI0035225579